MNFEKRFLSGRIEFVAAGSHDWAMTIQTSLASLGIGLSTNLESVRTLGRLSHKPWVILRVGPYRLQLSGTIDDLRL